jgi:hypothetical protein
MNAKFFIPSTKVPTSGQMRDHNITLHDSKSAINNFWDGNPGLAQVYSVHPLPQNSQRGDLLPYISPNYHTCVTPLTLFDGRTPLMWLLSRDTESSSTFMRADEVTKSEAIVHKLFIIFPVYNVSCTAVSFAQIACTRGLRETIAWYGHGQRLFLTYLTLFRLLSGKDRKK